MPTDVSKYKWNNVRNNSLRSVLFIFFLNYFFLLLLFYSAFFKVFFVCILTRIVLISKANQSKATNIGTKRAKLRPNILITTILICFYAAFL